MNDSVSVTIKEGIQTKKELLKTLKSMELIFKYCAIEGVQPDCFMEDEDLRHRQPFNNLKSLSVTPSNRSTDDDWDYYPQMKKSINQIAKAINALEGIHGDFQIKLQICWRMCAGIQLELYLYI